MAGLPYMQWFTGDWSRDAQVASLSLAGRGFWFELLQAMHSSRVGRLTGTAMSLSRIARCSPDEASACITELQSTRAAEVRVHDDGVTLTISSRRLSREENARNQARNRQKTKRSREKTESVTGKFPSDSDSGSGSCSVPGVGVQGKGDDPPIVFPPVLDTPAFRSAWDDFVVHRREKRKPMTARAAASAIAQLAEFGHDWSVDRLRAAVVNGWQGLIFAEDKQRATNGTHRPSRGSSRPTPAQAADERRADKARRECPETEPIRLRVV